MILDEHGLRWRLDPDGTEWRCLEVPALVMLRGGRYAVGAETLASLEAALAAAASVTREG